MKAALTIVHSRCVSPLQPCFAQTAALTQPKGASQPVDARGFIHRWLVLEPVPVPGRLTESAVQEALKLAAAARCRTPPTARGHRERRSQMARADTSTTT